MNGLSVKTAVALALAAVSVSGFAQSAAHKDVLAMVNEHAAQYKTDSRTIWEYAELGYHENKSSALLQKDLKAAGFTVQAGVAGEPTGFVATYGTGGPVIAILGEFDALPGLSQSSESAIRMPIVAGAAGHGCGHNLLGSGAALAAVAVKEYMEKNHINGTLRFYGTPAEEGGAGKVFMLRAGLFKDVDVVLQWHPADHNAVLDGGMLATTSAKFTFHGIAAHAAAAPDRGRSALDAVMLMGTGVEYMREHVPSSTRMHYIITKGGVASNIVPDLAQMSLTVRSPDGSTLAGIWERIRKVADGAALMTGTTVDMALDSSATNILKNDALAVDAQKNLEEVGGYSMTPAEMKFAAELQKTLPADGVLPLDTTKNVVTLAEAKATPPQASTDVGDVSWNVPTIGFLAATFVPGVAAHTWQAAASAGGTIGQQGMMVAAKAIALTAIDLMTTPKLVQDAKADFAKQMTGKTYVSMIPAGTGPKFNYREE
jgi:aminobenzoyl-glutamate utilization protein B